MKKLLLTVAFAFLIIFISNAQNKTFNLNREISKDYKEITNIKSSYTQYFENAIKVRELEINPVVQDVRLTGISDTIILDLFNDIKYKAIIKKVGIDVNGTISILAQLFNCTDSYFIISTSDNRSLITIDIPEKNELFVSRYIEETRQYYLIQIDKSKQKAIEVGPPQISSSYKKITDIKKLPHDSIQNKNVSIDIRNNSSIPKDETKKDTITMMILYTQAAASWSFSNEGSINNTISSLLVKSQLALDNSNVNLKLQLVHSEQVNYNEFDTFIDLTYLTDSTDGFMDNIHSLRNLYRADIVVLLEKIQSYGGLSWYFGEDPSTGFSFNRVQQVSWTYTTIHEIGHILGCGHHFMQNTSPGPGIYEYSSGWRWTDTDLHNYCDVMTYESGRYFADGIDHTRVAYFSNPDVSYHGTKTGDSILADNARTIRQTKSYVAGYRSGYVSPPFSPELSDPTNILETSFTANWYPSETADGYKLDVAYDIGFYSCVTGYKDLDVKNVTTFEVNGLDAKSYLFYRVRAYNLGGKSAYSDIKKVTTLSKPSSIPLSLTALSCDNIITLRWHKSTGSDFLRYHVIWGNVSNVSLTNIDSTSTNISDTIKVFNGLKKDQTYFFNVRAVNSDRQMSGLSNISTSKVKVGIIPKIRVKWGDILICSNLGDSIKSFQWYFGKSIIPQAVAQYFETKKIKGVYQVEIIDNDGCKHFSNSISISDLKSISLYPNPASESATIEMEGLSAEKAIVRIMNSSGIKVLEFPAEIENGILLQKIPVTNLKTGTYVVSVFLNQNDLCSSQILVVK